MTELEKILDFLTRSRSIPENTSHNDCLKSLSSHKTVADCHFEMMQLFDDAIEKMRHLIADETIRDRQIEKLMNVKRTVYHALNAPDTKNFKSRIENSDAVNTIEMTNDYLSILEKTCDAPINRENLVASTIELIASVSESDLPDYLKTVLLMKLRAVNSIALSAFSYSDQQLRRRIKAIYADFCAEFAQHDREYESLHEKFIRWAKAGIGIGVFSLGLTADGMSIYQALPKPDIKQLPKPDE